MRKFLLIIPCLFCSFSFQDGRDNEVNKIWTAQIQYLQGEEFIQKGITGRGIRIAILDVGFPGTNTHPALKHLIDRKQIIATWNFVKNRENVYTGVSHGTEVLSCIAGISEGRPLGLAPDAEFLLALTEQSGEPRQEELNWAKAVDWAIDHGADIIQSSLAYTYQRYFTSEMDGHQSIAAKAAARAARKGILIIISNGNEGQSRWQTVGTPADADSILSVGAIDPVTGLVAGYSSVGPTADKRLKPNVCASGKVVTLNPKGGTHIMEGTSFSAPLITGFAACTWQMNRSLSAQEIISLIEKSGHLFPYYDYSHGYGIPQASRIINPNQEKDSKTISLSADNESFSVSIPETSLITPWIMPGRYLYYHISNPSGYLIRYGVYRVNGDKPIVINKSGFEPGDVFRCSFNGETAVWKEKR
ncbi:MAG: S8 family serine peptidase [Bacteroidales bacterium]